jgi:hypothetical protein
METLHEATLEIECQFEMDRVQSFVLTELNLWKIHQTGYAYY